MSRLDNSGTSDSGLRVGTSEGPRFGDLPDRLGSLTVRSCSGKSSIVGTRITRMFVSQGDLRIVPA